MTGTQLALSELRTAKCNMHEMDGLNSKELNPHIKEIEDKVKG